MENNQLIANFFKFLQSTKGIQPEEKFVLKNIKYFTDSEITFNHSLDLSFEKIVALPRKLTVKGSLNCSDITILRKLPEELYVDNWIQFSNTSIKELPDKLSCTRVLDIRDTFVTTLPPNMKIKGFIQVDKDKLQYFIEKYPQYSFR